MKKVVLSMSFAFIVVSCTSTIESSPYKPSASEFDIKSAKRSLSKYDAVTVDDDGFIVVSHQIQSGYKWDKIGMRQYGYETACEWLEWYIDRGFIVNVWAKGRGGSYEFYNADRCAEGPPTNL